MRVLVKNVGGTAHIEYTEGTLTDIQKLVGGYLEPVCRIDGVVILVNEESILKDLNLNVREIRCDVADRILVGNTYGPIVIVGTSDEDWVSLTQPQQRRWLKTMGAKHNPEQITVHSSQGDCIATRRFVNEDQGTWEGWHFQYPWGNEFIHSNQTPDEVRARMQRAIERTVAGV